jgi:hypothetical protein
MAKFNHLYDVAFTVVSNTEDGSDVTPAMLRAALEKRIESLFASSESLEPLEAFGLCDTYEMEDDDA